MKVLVVDDEEEICKRLQAELQKEGYDVEYTTKAVGVVEKLTEAKKKGRDYAYELLLLDLRMPGIDGCTLLNEIRALGLDLDVIIITAYGAEDKAIEAISLGATDYLKKPISLEELRTAILSVQQKRAKEGAFEHHILVVDDERELCAYLKRELEKEGYPVAVAYDGSNGLQYFKNNRVDVVISDIKMPKSNGFKMLQECHEISDDFVSIIITGFSDHESAIMALRLGTFGYLRKPLSLEEVITVVGKGIAMLSLRRGLSIHERELEIENALEIQYAEKIEREKMFSEDIIAAIPDSLLVLDKALRIKSVNQSLYEKIQTEPENVIGSSISDILPDKDGTLSTKLTQLLGTEDMLNNFEIHYQSEKFGERIFNIRARRMSSAEEELVVIEDITERKRMEEELLNYVAELKQFNRLAVGRELRMIELKKEVNKAYERLGETPPYDLSFVGNKIKNEI